MTFKPTKCHAWEYAMKSPVSEYLARSCIHGEKPNALLVPLVPGMEAVVRAHLAAKPKPAKKPAKKSTKSLLSQAPRRITRFVPRPGRKARPAPQS